ncbi:ALP1-like protein, partial [Tanacetum coccineum]
YTEDIMFTYTEGEEEVVSQNVNFLTRAMSLIRNRRRANRPMRSIVHRDRYGAHDRLVTAFFSEHQIYNEYRFWKTFRMSRTLFNRIVHEVTNHSSFFRDNIDCTGKEGISPLMKCTSAIRQLAYGIVPDFLDEYLQITQCVRRDHGSNPFILLEAVASQDLWIWHAFFGVSGSNNDINVLHQSPLFNDLKTGRAPEIPFVANGVTYPWGYYLVDGIYPELLTFAKTISDDDHKRILYKRSGKERCGTSV